MTKHKIPHPYSAAEESAASLTGIRDDVYIEVIFGRAVNRHDKHSA